jgi:hypothetical protein
MTPKQITILLALALISLLCIIGFTSCTVKYSGVLYECKNDTVICSGQTFKILTNIPKCGTKATFKATNNKRKINCLKLKN